MVLRGSREKAKGNNVDGQSECLKQDARKKMGRERGKSVPGMGNSKCRGSEAPEPGGFQRRPPRLDLREGGVWRRERRSGPGGPRSRDHRRSLGFIKGPQGATGGVSVRRRQVFVFKIHPAAAWSMGLIEGQQGGQGGAGMRTEPCCALEHSVVTEMLCAYAACYRSHWPRAAVHPLKCS